MAIEEIVFGIESTILTILLEKERNLCLSSNSVIARVFNRKLKICKSKILLGVFAEFG